MIFWPAAALALPPVDEPLHADAKAPADSAVVVGIEDYFVLPDAPYAENDATAFYGFLRHTRGVPLDRISLLKGSVTREQLLEAVRVTGSSTGPGGRVWVYFAGHGAASPDTGERVLLGADVQTDIATFRARAIPISEVKELATAGGGEALLILDACYSGRGRAGADLLDGKRAMVPSWATVPEAPAGEAVEWSAAGPDQWSAPLHPAKHGAFTYLALGALRGWADGQVDGRRDGQVTLREAHAFVEAGLRTLGMSDQSPIVLGDQSWSLSHGSEAAPSLEPQAADPDSVGASATLQFLFDGKQGDDASLAWVLHRVLVNGLPLRDHQLEVAAGQYKVEVLARNGKALAAWEGKVASGEIVRLDFDTGLDRLFEIERQQPQQQ